MFKSRRTARAFAAIMAVLLAFCWTVPPLAAQDASEAATQRYIQQRLEALQQTQQRLAAEFEQVRESDPQRAAYLAALVQENQVLAQRYEARLQGRAIEGYADERQAATPQPGPGGYPGDPAGPAPERAAAGEASEGPMGKITEMLGGGKMDTTELIVSLVAGLGGWWVGKMAFGMIGGIAGGILAPILAKWILKKVREMRGDSPDGNPGKQSPPPGASPEFNGGFAGKAGTAIGAPVYSGQQAAASSASISEAKSNLDAAYLSVQEASRQGLPPAEVAQRRNVYEQWQLRYNQLVGGR